MINRFTYAREASDELLFTLDDPDAFYSHSEVCDLLDRAEQLGFSLDGPELKALQTVRQLEILISRRQ